MFCHPWRTTRTTSQFNSSTAWVQNGHTGGGVSPSSIGIWRPRRGVSGATFIIGLCVVILCAKVRKKQCKIIQNAKQSCLGTKSWNVEWDCKDSTSSCSWCASASGNRFDSCRQKLQTNCSAQEKTTAIQAGFPLHTGLSDCAMKLLDAASHIIAAASVPTQIKLFKEEMAQECLEPLLLQELRLSGRPTLIAILYSILDCSRRLYQLYPFCVTKRRKFQCLNLKNQRFPSTLCVCDRLHRMWHLGRTSLT